MRLVRPDLLRKKQIVNRLFSVMIYKNFIVSDDDLWWAWEQHCASLRVPAGPLSGFIDALNDDQLVAAIRTQLIAIS